MWVLFVKSVVLLLLEIFKVECWYRAYGPLLSGWIFGWPWAHDPAIEACEFVEPLRVHLEGIVTIYLARAKARAIYVWPVVVHRGEVATQIQRLAI